MFYGSLEGGREDHQASFRSEVIYNSLRTWYNVSSSLSLHTNPTNLISYSLPLNITTSIQQLNIE